MKRFCSFFLAVWILIPFFSCLFCLSAAAEKPALAGEAKSVFLMEAETGRILYEYEADLRLPPASVTKIMTILLTVEEIERGNLNLADILRVSDNASRMGGSQVYLKAGEEMSVEDLLKSAVVASANDACTVLAEHIAGSVESFVDRMNARAEELGMTNTRFENPTGLDDSTVDHRTTARDIALMSRALLEHPMIFRYTTIWMDSIRDGAFGLTNTNRLIRFYAGANGLKTGSTSRSGFCISATAKRDGMQLIAVVMGSPTRDSRNETAKKLLDYGFANYRYLYLAAAEPEPIRVLGGTKDTCHLIGGAFDTVLTKAEAGKSLESEIRLPDSLTAPVEAGDVVGEIVYSLEGQVLGSVPIAAAEPVPRIGFLEIFGRLLKRFFLHGSDSVPTFSLT